jgi:hypothetical protein
MSTTPPIWFLKLNPARSSRGFRGIGPSTHRTAVYRRRSYRKIISQLRRARHFPRRPRLRRQSRLFRLSRTRSSHRTSRNAATSSNTRMSQIIRSTKDTPVGLFWSKMEAYRLLLALAPHFRRGPLLQRTGLRARSTISGATRQRMSCSLHK